ncbi:MAG: hypothetical protein Q8P81_03345 [Nanoarchaeota archaeon]|nr:hypothetical protein [Nanoarchaeota archaeon]
MLKVQREVEEGKDSHVDIREGEEDKTDYSFPALRPKHFSNKIQPGLRTFTLARKYDESKVSGVGICLQGIIFSNSQVVVNWLSPTPKGSIAIFDRLEDFLRVHVTPHKMNKTVITFDDGETMKFDEENDS